MYEGKLDGSMVCIKRVRIYTKDGPQKATKVRSDTDAFPVRHH